MVHRDLIVPWDRHTGGLMKMPVGRQNPGSLWVDGSIALRVRDKGQRSWRMVKIRRPFAIIGSHPEADLVIPRPGVEPHHVFVFLDARGLFGVDLRSQHGTRFAGTIAEAAWLGSGDLIEVGDHVIEVVQLRVDGAVVSGPLADDDPLGPIDHDPRNPLVGLTLRMADRGENRWSIGSSLVFLGRGPACAVAVGDESAGATAAALLRHGRAAYLVRFPGATARFNDELAPAAVRLDDGDLLQFGPDAVLVQTHDLAEGPATPPYGHLVARLELAVGPENCADLDFAFGDYHSDRSVDPVDYPTLIGRLQAETAALVAVLLRRIEALDDEMAELRAEMDRLATHPPGAQPASPPVEKLRWDLIPQAEPDAERPDRPDAWLVDRLRVLEVERQSAWSNLVGRLGATKKPPA